MAGEALCAQIWNHLGHKAKAMASVSAEQDHAGALGFVIVPETRFKTLSPLQQRVYGVLNMSYSS